MTTQQPPWLDAVREDPERARLEALTAAEKLAIFAELCALSDAILASRPDRSRLLRSREPMSTDAERQWRELIERNRGA